MMYSLINKYQQFKLFCLHLKIKGNFFVIVDIVNSTDKDKLKIEKSFFYLVNYSDFIQSHFQFS